MKQTKKTSASDHAMDGNFRITMAHSIKKRGFKNVLGVILTIKKWVFFVKWSNFVKEILFTIWDDYGIQRSGRRFFTTHCINMGVLPFLIELQARWQTDRANGQRSVQRTMIHTYAEVRNMKDTLKKPSQAC